MKAQTQNSTQIPSNSTSCPKACSDRIADYPCLTPVTVQKSVTTPELAAKTQGTIKYSSQSLRKRDGALTVSSPSLASANAVAIPNFTLLRSLRKYWHARTINQAANGSEAWDSLAARQNTIYPYSTETPVRKRRVKVLILGASESGKTTLLRDIRLYTGGGYTCEERTYFAEIIAKALSRAFESSSKQCNRWEFRFSRRKTSTTPSISSCGQPRPEKDARRR